MIRFMHQNFSKLSKGMRAQFTELDDEEVARIEAEYREAFSPDPAFAASLLNTNS